MGAIAVKQSSNDTTKKHKVNEQIPGTAGASIFSSPNIAIQRKPSCPCGGGCPRCHDNSSKQTEQLLKDNSSDQVEPLTVPPIVHEVLRSPGHPLDPATRTFMEQRFGHDFSRVRVHSDSAAGQSARDVNAYAYTVGQDIVSGFGQFAPGTHAGRRLLAHELAHTLQQTKGTTAGAERISDPRDPAEQEADRAASDVIAERKADVKKAANGGTLHRWPWPLPAQKPSPSEQKPSSPEQKPAPPEQKPVPPEQKSAPPVLDCDKKPLVESWGRDTCCSRRGFIDDEAVNKKTGEKISSCNKWPLFLALHAKEHGLQGVASCKPSKLGQKAQIKVGGNTLTVGCIDTRAKENNVIEIDGEAAGVFLGSKQLREHADEVCYGGSFDSCEFNTTCREFPKETWCLPIGVTKAETTDSPAKHGWAKR
jgi:hypothetical protein